MCKGCVPRKMKTVLEAGDTQVRHTPWSLRHRLQESSSVGHWNSVREIGPSALSSVDSSRLSFLLGVVPRYPRVGDESGTGSGRLQDRVSNRGTADVQVLSSGRGRSIKDLEHVEKLM